MTTLIDHLRVLLGEESLSNDVALLTATDARAARLPRLYGVLYSDAVQEAIDQLAQPGSCTCDSNRSAYYLGLHVGWRVAHRLR
jgi:hypothetical protein